MMCSQNQYQTKQSSVLLYSVGTCLTHVQRIESIFAIYLSFAQFIHKQKHIECRFHSKLPIKSRHTCSLATSAGCFPVAHVLLVRFVTRKLIPPLMTSVTECGSNSSGLLSNASKLYFLSICTNPTLDTILPRRKAATKRKHKTCIHIDS